MMVQGRGPQADGTGQDLPGFTAPPRPDMAPMQGRFVRLEPLSADLHAADLFRAFNGHERLWDYMPYGPFASSAAYHRWAKEREAAEDPRFFVLRDPVTGACGGVASYLRITPEMGVIEVGNICFAPDIQQSPMATEA